ncbi:hypothetical protein CY34DRAFT_90811, partial [Suillus luteus UH-Slu-Lm8-n1]
NTLANFICLHVIYLCECNTGVLCEVYLAYCPFPISLSKSKDDLLQEVLVHKFSDATIASLVLLVPSPSTYRKAASQWPQPVSTNVALTCLNLYMQGFAWTEPPVCAVCS